MFFIETSTLTDIRPYEALEASLHSLTLYDLFIKTIWYINIILI